ncbi:Asp-tRNA(Asn)/Glu-tRNA(Gln) amidotransferase subunit GatA [Candidatus Shapirobacteria bacterium]|nr:Asp-tRNA(Asn)/Glu-tRNA(Gln) amidotransferase subunit GatA [Candidatus Shapirobacteria bacterium]
MELNNLTITKIRQGLLDKKFTAVEVATNYLDRINKLDQEVRAFITVTPEIALEQAKLVDKKISEGKDIGRLAGSTVAVKDIFLTKGIQSTSGSRVLEGYIPQYSSTVFEKVMSEDAILIGKVNCDPFAFGVSTENSGYFSTHNPWDLSRIPGGSSGGSAAAVAATFSTFALGSDTGGSIRQPAAMCGVSGIKVTYGRTSRYGVTSMASSFDTMGSLSSTVEDLALITETMAGIDPHDATSSSESVPAYSQLLDKVSLKGLKIGLPKEYFSEALNPEIKQKVMEAAQLYQKHGATLVDISLPSTSLGIDVYYILVPSEISANMSRYDGLRFGPSVRESKDLISYYMENRGQFMEPEVKRRIIIGTYALSSGYYDAYYLKASKVRTVIKQEFQDVFQKVDVILAPVCPSTAWPLGQKVNDPLQMYLEDVFTVCINVAGLPSLAVPCGFDGQNLPLGYQLIGNYFTEDRLFSIGHQYQQLTDFHLQKPKLNNIK